VVSKKRDYNIPVCTANFPKFEAWSAAAEEYICSLSIVENPPKEKPRHAKKTKKGKESLRECNN